MIYQGDSHASSVEFIWLSRLKTIAAHRLIGLFVCAMALSCTTGLSQSKKERIQALQDSCWRLKEVIDRNQVHYNWQIGVRERRLDSLTQILTNERQSTAKRVAQYEANQEANRREFERAQQELEAARNELEQLRMDLEEAVAEMGSGAEEFGESDDMSSMFFHFSDVFAQIRELNISESVQQQIIDKLTLRAANWLFESGGSEIWLELEFVWRKYVVFEFTSYFEADGLEIVYQNIFDLQTGQKVSVLDFIQPNKTKELLGLLNHQLQQLERDDNCLATRYEHLSEPLSAYINEEDLAGLMFTNGGGLRMEYIRFDLPCPTFVELRPEVAKTFYRFSPLD